MKSIFVTKENENVLFKFSLNLEVFVTLLTLFGMWLSFYIMYHSDSMLIKGIVFGIFANILLAVLFPLLWVCIYKKEPLSSLGLTKHLWLPSLIIGFSLAYVKLFQLIPLMSSINWPMHILYNLFLFWEPFFIFGWLQSRFEKSFGILGGVLFAGLSLGLYHIGSFPPENVLIITLNGIVFAAIYRLTKNLLIMYPLLWCINSSVGTACGGLTFGIEVCLMYIFIFLIQVGLILLIYKKTQQKTQGSR